MCDTCGKVPFDFVRKEPYFTYCHSIYQKYRTSTLNYKNHHGFHVMGTHDKLHVMSWPYTYMNMLRSHVCMYFVYSGWQKIHGQNSLLLNIRWICTETWGFIPHTRNGQKMLTWVVQGMSGAKRSKIWILPVLCKWQQILAFDRTIELALSTKQKTTSLSWYCCKSPVPNCTR